MRIGRGLRVSKQLVAPLTFLVLTTIGIVLIFSSKIVSEHQTFPSILAAATMLVYASVSFLLPGARLRSDQTGDNLYYMGFVFTLTSLAVSLAAQNPEKIIANFGVAISSTLLGIILRIFIQQFRFDPDDIEQASRVELSEATRRVRQELDETILNLQDFRRSSTQAMTEGFGEIQSNIGNITNSLLEAMEELARQSNEPIKTLSTSVCSSLEKVANDLSQISDSLNSSSRSQVDFSHQSENATSSLKEFSQSLFESDRSTEASVSRIEKKVDESIEKLDVRVAEKIDKISNDFSDFSTQLERVESEFSASREQYQTTLNGRVDDSMQLSLVVKNEIGELEGKVESLAKSQSSFTKSASMALSKLKQFVPWKNTESR
jgi:hypothetical protein